MKGFLLLIALFFSLSNTQIVFPDAVRFDPTQINPSLAGIFELNFGTSVTSIGDLDNDGLDELLVGAWGYNDFEGTAFVLFLNQSRAMTSVFNITVPPSVTRFGFNVANLGDINGDTWPEVAITSMSSVDGQDLVHVYTIFQNTAVLNSTTNSSPFTAFRYGHSVAVISDINSDGINDLAIGAPGDMQVEGSVIIATLAADGTITNQNEIGNGLGGFGINLETDARFGYSVANIGDFDGNGFDEIVVGSPRNSDFSPDSGILYVLFLGPGGLVISEHFIQSFNPAGGNTPRRFGSSLSAADIDQDGTTDLIVGLSFNNIAAVLLLTNQSGNVSISSTSLLDRPPESGSICSGPDDCGIATTLSFNEELPLVVLACAREQLTGSLYFVTPSLCGNGVRSDAEGCDDGNMINGDGCNFECVIEDGWVCQVNTQGPDSCQEICGDFEIRGSETCDDGNLDSGDGCSSFCQVENGFMCAQCSTVCGDGIVAGDEQCEPSVDTDCSGSCQRNKLNTAGLISGIVLGFFCVACLVGALVSLLIYTSRKKKSTELDSIISVFEGVPILQDVQIRDVIGQGQFGKVYSATWNGVDIALKTLNDPKNSSLQNEMALMVNFRHPNVLGLFGLYVHEEELMMATELMDRGDLLNILHHDPELTASDFVTFTKQIATGMAYLHSQNILHRDLACRNILATGDSPRISCKISDFGLSRFTQEYYQSNDKKIPIRWTAPEVIEFGKVSKSSDVWSFSIVIYEIFSRGGIPYAGMANRKVIEKVHAGYRLPAPDMPDLIAQIFKRGLSESAEQRPNFSEISGELSEFSVSTHSVISSKTGSKSREGLENYPSVGDFISEQPQSVEATKNTFYESCDQGMSIYDDRQVDINFKKYQAQHQK